MVDQNLQQQKIKMPIRETLKKQLTKLLTLAFISVFTLGSCQEHKKMTQEKNDVLKVIEKMVTSLKNKDIKGVMSTYEKHAVIVFEPEKPESKEEIIRKKFLELMEVSPNFAFHGHEVYISGNIATHINPWSMEALAPDGSIIKQKGLSIVVLRKQKNGKWLMVLDNPYGDNLLNKKG
ncbi:DUF4440 domain-containing protein [Flavivirga abyssicola]|uniref:YybH family protein n=1 Tax=Flavivirga abyssicola TaxID=3063533 RepID=UPI0026DFA32D|nr:DUF4440 domain-containing protein [Flavivirga sp. MEBiC07777]WVK12459.1 DUF4440 domain-containing protein [Flavivirga sp. MEBiC07777]